MINIHCLLAIYCLEINHFRIDLLTAFFTLRVLLPQRSHCPSSQMLITKQKTLAWPYSKQRRKSGARRNTPSCTVQKQQYPSKPKVQFYNLAGGVLQTILTYVSKQNVFTQFLVKYQEHWDNRFLNHISMLQHL